MRITLRRTWGATPEVYDRTWSELRDWLIANAGITYVPNPDRKKKPPDLPLLAFGAFDVPDAQGLSYRGTNLNPEGLCALALDFDDTPAADFARVLEHTKRMNPGGGLAHTTWKHGLGPLGTVRARLIVPLDDYVCVSSWEFFWETCVQHVRADVTGLDKQCRNVERTYYLPASNPEAPWPCWVDAW